MAGRIPSSNAAPFDADRLKGLIRELGEHFARLGRDTRLSQIHQTRKSIKRVKLLPRDADLLY